MGSLDSDVIELWAMNAAQQCCDLTNRWTANHARSWVQSPDFGLPPPTGGLSAYVNHINVSLGDSFSYEPWVFDGFFDPGTIAHTHYLDETPNLASGTRISSLPHQGKSIDVEWLTGYEALSSVITTTTIENDFEIIKGQGGQMEWVISFPTLDYYREDTRRKPFNFANVGGNPWFRDFYFPGDWHKDLAARVDAGIWSEDAGINRALGHPHYLIFDESGLQQELFYGEIPFCEEIQGVVSPPEINTCVYLPLSTLRHKTNVMVIRDQLDFQGITSNIANSTTVNSMHVGFNESGQSVEHGKFKIDLSGLFAIRNDTGREVGTGREVRLYGLPVVGFSLKRYFNANAQSGKLGTYSFTRAHQGRVKVEML